MHTLYFEIDGEMKIYQVESLLNVDPVILKFFLNLIKEDIKELKNFVKKNVKYDKKITFSDYKDFLYINDKKSPVISISYSQLDQSETRVDLDYWIDYSISNFDKFKNNKKFF